MGRVRARGEDRPGRIIRLGADRRARQGREEGRRAADGSKESEEFEAF